MLANQQNKKLRILLLGVFIILVIPAQAQAYIGHGASFPAAGSLLMMFAATLSAMLALFTWPIRYIIRAICGKVPQNNLSHSSCSST